MTEPGSNEFPAAGPSAGISSQIESDRSTPMVLRNSRFLIGVTMGMGVMAAIISLAFVILVLSECFPLSDFNLDKARDAARWMLAAALSGSACPWLWNLGLAMVRYSVRLDHRGVEFRLGSKKDPKDLFLGWDQVAAIKRKRIGSAQYYFVEGTDGSVAGLSSYNFFRPRKVALLIAARAGRAIEKA